MPRRPNCQQFHGGLTCGCSLQSLAARLASERFLGALFCSWIEAQIDQHPLDLRPSNGVLDGAIIE